jgi:hypothetical protein
VSYSTTETRRPRGIRPTYEATLEQDGAYWLVKVPGSRGIEIEVVDPAEAEEAIRGAIAVLFDVEPDTFDVVVTRLIRWTS